MPQLMNGVKREFRTDDVWLMQGDACQIVPELSGRYDCIIADIPYGEVSRDSGGLRNLDKGEADLETFPISFVVEQSSRLADTVYIWCGTEQVSELRAGFVARDMTTRLCGWEKTNPSPMNGDKFWLSSFECCVFARKPKAFFSEHCASPIWRGPIQREQVHPTQKPEWLIDRLVKASVPDGGSVLDFCCGSGTTLLSAYRFGCRAVGVELDSGHFDTAVGRLKVATRPLLFPKSPKAVNEQRSIFTEDVA